MDPNKVEEISEYPTLTNLTQLRLFLGLCEFFHRFVNGYSHHATPLTNLTKKGALFRLVRHRNALICSNDLWLLAQCLHCSISLNPLSCSVTLQVRGLELSLCKTNIQLHMRVGSWEALWCGGIYAWTERPFNINSDNFCKPILMVFWYIWNKIKIKMIHIQNKNQQQWTLNTLTVVEWGQDLMKSGRPLSHKQIYFIKIIENLISILAITIYGPLAAAREPFQFSCTLLILGLLTLSLPIVITMPSI